MDQKKRGIVYTFYSFKGGAGRTMALANVATVLAGWNYQVLVVDWDLEAPGIERFFTATNSDVLRLRQSRPGIVDLIKARAVGETLNWQDCVIDVKGGVSLITAGRADDKYIDCVQTLDFDGLFRTRGLGTYIEELRNQWIAEFDFVLIDSRTGITDIGGICTVHLPDIIVLFMTATDSSTEGALEVIHRARRAQEQLPLDRGHLIVIPVITRDESRTEYEMSVRWKVIFVDRFQSFYADWLPRSIQANEAVEMLRIPYVPYWSFGEELPVLREGTSDPTTISYAYEFLARLLATRLDWFETMKGRAPAPPPIAGPVKKVDEEWLNKCRTDATQGLIDAGKTGFKESYHFCLDRLAPKPQNELLAIARQAMVHTFGWPIGVVLDNRPDFRPRPTNDGILAVLDTEHDFDYWVLTKTGDFYILSSLFEDIHESGVIYFNTRIVRTTELIMHCINIYKGFGASPSANISLSIRYGGLSGRFLSATRSRFPLLDRKQTKENEVTASVVFELGVSESEIVSLVKELCMPLFMVFDFSQFHDDTYSQIVTNYLNGKVV